jgi:hypothetical protein
MGEVIEGRKPSNVNATSQLTEPSEGAKVPPSRWLTNKEMS